MELNTKEISMPSLTREEEIVLSFPKLKSRIEVRPGDKAKALKNLKEIRADFSEKYIKSFEKFLDTTLGQLYDGINLNPNNVDLEDLVNKNCVVLVPNHQSHADYMAINYVVYKNYKFPLYVAGGKNLDIFPIGKLFRKSGCFFIRRSFHNDILYKLTLEAYLYYLLKEQKPIEFFFEGGRSRTGRLLPPRYGLYQMLIEAHELLKEENPDLGLVFVPVSIVHEYVPEQKSLAKELKGKKKSKESTGQLFGLVKLFSYQFGNVHINLGNPIKVEKSELELKKRTQSLAFDCFREVGKNMAVTPTSLLALTLLDEPMGALKWDDILSKARGVLNYCQKFNVPFTESLKEEKLEKTLGRAIDILIGNKKVDVIGTGEKGHIFYSIKDECRLELLYFKNTILHHFLVPAFINSAWVKLFQGEVTTFSELMNSFIDQREQMKHEFYLPTVKQMFFLALDIISDAVGRKINTLEECMDFSHKDLYNVLQNIGHFSRSLNFISEAYYTSAETIKKLDEQNTAGFSMELYLKTTHDVFEHEKSLARHVKYPESYSEPMMRSALKYFTQLSVLEFESGKYKVVDLVKLNQHLERLEKSLLDKLIFNIRS